MAPKAHAGTDPAVVIPKGKQEYAYCMLTKTKFLILRRTAGSTVVWNHFAAAVNESAARHMVTILNKHGEK